MSFNIKQGLFQFDFEDHHAILGVPLDADFNTIRKRYMLIARRLHPDSSKVESPADKKLATQLLSKLANPAYSKLTNDSSRAEHGVLLGMMSKRLVQEKDKVKLKSETAQKLLTSPNLETDYQESVAKLGKQAYETLSQTLERIGEISELNLVYLQRKESKGETVGKPAADKKAAKAAPGKKKAEESPTQKPVAGEATADTETSAPSKIDNYCRRAENFLAGGDFDGAVNELKEGLKIQPKNSRAHGLLGQAYLKKNQATLAKVHINQALKLNPKEESALDAQKQLQKQIQKTAKEKDNKSPIAAFFSNLLGGKKKK
ncbi:tetratricopeptide repeat protein [Oscillatoria sp. HE19RPO]|uniref:J domain-containing protein n=1 Tax=Oscillatoria sp. HE19RPO TaxID=2954806 RepID=UPI0020C577CD|nr:tetratricopeptide repeat protein [Oscillatoria sp. HE19RPO]